MFTGKKTTAGKLIIVSVVFTLLLGLWTCPAVNAVTIDPNAKAELVLSRELNKSKILLNDEFTVTYKIQPQPIPAKVVIQPDREIYLVIDTSGSMNYNLAGKEIPKGGKEKTRLAIARDAAFKFLDKLNGKNGVKVGLITYDNIGHVKQSLTTDIESVKRQINKLAANGGTNIGDGLRLGYYRLMDSKSTGGDTVNRYLVLLTDGEPTFHSIYKWNPYSFYYEDGIAPDYRGGGSYAWPQDIQYCYDIAERYIKNSGIKSYMIAFTKGSNANVLNEIARKAGGVYKQAEDSDALEKVYDEIYDEIIVDFSVENVKFEEKFPEGLAVVSVPEGFTVNGQTVTGNLKSIDYSYNAGKKAYEAKPVEFTIKLKGTRSGNYLLNNSRISYTNINNNTETKEFGEKSVEVVAVQAPIEVDRSLNNEEIIVGEEFTVNYSVVPGALSIDPGIEAPGELVVKNVEFSEEFPEGLDVVSAGRFRVTGRKVSGTLGNIVYRYDRATGKYKADPVNFSITLKGTRDGEYILGKEGTSKVGYADLDNETESRSFPELNVRVLKFGEPKLEVLKVVKRGEYVDVTLKITLPKRSEYGEVRTPVVSNGTLTQDINGGELVVNVSTEGRYDTEYTATYEYRNLSIFKTHRVWLYAKSVSGEISKTGIITIYEGININ